MNVVLSIQLRVELGHQGYHLVGWHSNRSFIHLENTLLGESQEAVAFHQRFFIIDVVDRHAPVIRCPPTPEHLQALGRPHSTLLQFSNSFRDIRRFEVRVEFPIYYHQHSISTSFVPYFSDKITGNPEG